MTFTHFQISLSGHGKEVWDRFENAMEDAIIFQDQVKPRLILSDQAFVWAKQHPHLSLLVKENLVYTESNHPYDFKVDLGSRDYYLVT